MVPAITGCFVALSSFLQSANLLPSQDVYRRHRSLARFVLFTPAITTARQPVIHPPKPGHSLRVPPHTTAARHSIDQHTTAFCARSNVHKRLENLRISTTTTIFLSRYMSIVRLRQQGPPSPDETPRPCFRSRHMHSPDNELICVTTWSSLFT